MNNFLSNLTQIIPGTKLTDALTATRLNAIQDAIKALARGENLKAGPNTTIKRNLSGVSIAALLEGDDVENPLRTWAWSAEGVQTAIKGIGQAMGGLHLTEGIDIPYPNEEGVGGPSESRAPTKPLNITPRLVDIALHGENFVETRGSYLRFLEPGFYEVEIDTASMLKLEAEEELWNYHNMTILKWAAIGGAVRRKKSGEVVPVTDARQIGHTNPVSASVITETINTSKRSPHDMNANIAFRFYAHNDIPHCVDTDAVIRPYYCSTHDVNGGAREEFGYHIEPADPEYPSMECPEYDDRYLEFTVPGFQWAPFEVEVEIDDISIPTFTPGVTVTEEPVLVAWQTPPIHIPNKTLEGTVSCQEIQIDAIELEVTVECDESVAVQIPPIEDIEIPVEVSDSCSHYQSDPCEIEVGPITIEIPEFEVPCCCPDVSVSDVEIPAFTPVCSVEIEELTYEDIYLPVVEQYIPGGQHSVEVAPISIDDVSVEGRAQIQIPPIPDVDLKVLLPEPYEPEERVPGESCSEPPEDDELMSPGVWTDGGKSKFCLEVLPRKPKEAYGPRNRWGLDPEDYKIRYMEIEGSEVKIVKELENTISFFAHTAHYERESKDHPSNDPRWMDKQAELLKLHVHIKRLGEIENITHIDRPAGLPGDLSEKRYK